MHNLSTHTYTPTHPHTDSSLYHKDPLKAEKTCCLLTHLLCSLHKCFLYSQAAPTSFLTRERFDTLMPPLVHQVRATLAQEGSLTTTLTPPYRLVMSLAVKRRSNVAWRHTCDHVWLSWQLQLAKKNCGNHSTTSSSSKQDTKLER